MLVVFHLSISEDVKETEQGFKPLRSFSSGSGNWVHTERSREDFLFISTCVIFGLTDMRSHSIMQLWPEKDLSSPSNFSKTGVSKISPCMLFQAPRHCVVGGWVNEHPKCKQFCQWSSFPKFCKEKQRKRFSNLLALIPLLSGELNQSK